MSIIETSKERMFEVDIHRIAGQIALMSPETDAIFQMAQTIAPCSKKTGGKQLTKACRFTPPTSSLSLL
jgi:hypothetical protein